MIKYISFIFMLLLLTGCGNGDDGLLGPPTPPVEENTIVNMTISPASTRVPVGLGVRYRAYVEFSDGSVSDVTHRLSTWSSSAPEIASVKGSKGLNGYVQGNEVGRTTITASLSVNGEVFSATTELEVTEAVIESLVVAPVSKTMPVGVTRQFVATAYLSDGTSLDVTNEDTMSWRSSDIQIATVNANGVAKGESVGSTTITASILVDGETFSADATLEVTDAVINSVVVTPASKTTPVGLTRQFVATAYFSDGSSLDVTNEDTVSWRSSDSQFVTVNANGVAKGESVGSATITASLLMDGKAFSADAVLEVTDAVIKSLVVTPTSKTTPVGLTRQFVATAYFSDGSSLDVTNEDTVSWRSSDSQFATVNINGVAKGESVGSATITASMLVDGDTFSADAVLEVTDAVIESLVVTPTSKTTPVGLTRQFVATAYFSDGTSLDVTDEDTVSWQASDRQIVTVDTHGVAEGESVGSATITASIWLDGEAISASATIEVTDAVIESLVVTPASKTTPVGLTRQFVATACMSDGTSLDVTNEDTVSWQTSDSQFVTVNTNGVAKGESVGFATITASMLVDGETISADAALEVTDAVIKSLVVTPTSKTTPVGLTRQFVATAYFSDGSSLDVTNEDTVSWQTSGSQFATVNTNGVAKGESVGFATITASILADGETLVADAVLEVTDAVIQSLVVTPTSKTTPVGLTRQFVATAYFSDGSSLDVTNEDTVSWQTSDSQFATVNTNGVAKGESVGFATITASMLADGATFTADAALEVTDAVIESLVVTPTSKTTPVGLTRQFVATAYFSDGSSLDVTNEDTVSWRSSDSQFATVNTNGVAKGELVGFATITASVLTDGKTFTADATLEVTDAVIKSLVVTPTSKTTPVGLTRQFVATAYLSDGTSLDVTNEDTVSWRSSDSRFATVNTNGVAKGESVGFATITASILADGETFSADAALEVIDAVIESLGVTPASKTTPVGLTRQFVATAYLSDGTSLDVTNEDTVSWRSSDSRFATVDTNGVAKGESVGFATITASILADGKTFTADAALEVTDAVIKSLVVTPASKTTPVGLTRQFVATAYFSDDTSLDVTNEDTVSWRSSDSQFATVDTNGVAKGESVGFATITASMSVDGETFSADAALEVTDAVIESLVVSSDSNEVPAGLTVAFTVTAYLSDGSSSDVTNDATTSWSTSDPNIATVDINGNATGQSVGNVNVIALVSTNAQTLTANANLNVISAVAVGVEIDTSSVIPLGLTSEIKVNVIYSDNKSYDVTNNAIITSSSSNIVFEKVDTVRGVRYGQANITAVYQNFDATELVKVNSGICGHDPEQEIGSQLGGGINDRLDNTKGEACLKVATGTYQENTLYFSGPPSEEFITSMGTFIVDNSSTNSMQSVARFYGPPEHPEERFATFRGDGFMIEYPSFVGSQSDRWCQTLADFSFGGRNTWRTPTRDELETLINGRNMNREFNWAAGHNWTTTVCTDERSREGFWGVNNRGSSPIGSCFYKSRNTYSSCIAD
ncbi:Ig-like domain-containing protein [Vibrio owensii]|uniref:Ig-like domain-containing protein n=2 Tax=Vibrio owensii TaxID=696485 RepID=UPI003AAF22CD